MEGTRLPQHVVKTKHAPDTKLGQPHELKRSTMAEDRSICGNNISKAKKARIVHHKGYDTFSVKKSVHTLIQ